MLADDLDQDIMHRRLQYACYDCEEAWDVVCDITLPIICQLVGNEVLGTVGAQAVDTTCTQFGDLCDSLSAAEVCDGNCVEGKKRWRILRSINHDAAHNCSDPPSAPPADANSMEFHISMRLTATLEFKCQFLYPFRCY